MTPSSRATLKKAAWPLGVIAVAVLAVGACELQGWPFLRRPAQDRLSRQLQRDVQFGDAFRLKLFGSIRLDTDALRIGPPNGLAADAPLGGNLIDAHHVHLALPYSTVWHLMRGRTDEPPHITSLRVGAVEAALKRLPDGRANWTLGAPHPDSQHTTIELPVVDELVVENGHVLFDDGMIKTALDAHVDTSEGAQAPAPAASSAPSTGASPTTGLHIDGKGRREDRPFSFRVTSSGALPLVSRDQTVRVPVTIRLDARDAKFSFNGTATDVLSLEALDGDAVLSGPSLAKVGDALGITLPTTEPFTLKGRLGKSAQLWSLKKIDLDVGDSRLGGDFSFDRAPKVPMLSGELTGSRLVLADLAPAFGAPRPGTGNPTPPPGRVLPQREFDIPSLHAMNASVRLRLQRADLGSFFKEPIEPLHGDLALTDGVLKISNLLAHAAGGEITGALALDPNHPQPTYNADLRWAGIELERWLRPRNKTSQEKKPSGESPGFISGRLGGHAQLHGSGKSTAQWVASTEGTVQGWVRDGTLSHLLQEAVGLDIAQGLGVLIKGDDRMPMNCAAVKADAKNGLLVPEVAIVDTRDSTLLASGSVSLVDETLDMRITAKPKDMSPATLRTPIKVEGTFAAPHVSLDPKPIGTKLAAAAALATINPLAALIPLFDAGDKKGAGHCEETLARLRDANGPASARDAKAPKPADVAKQAEPAPRHAAAQPPVRR